MPATTVFVATADRRAAAEAFEATTSARATSGDPITVIRRRPHPPMRGDLRLGRRVARALGRSAR